MSINYQPCAPPAFAALAELQGRLRAIAHTQAANARYTKAIGEKDYYLHSTAFMLARAFGAQEVLRVRMATFDYAELYENLEGMTTAFSHGASGFQFFRLEQREIGERMLTVSDPDSSAYMTLSEFLDRIEGQDRPRWMKTICSRAERLLNDPLLEVTRLQAIDEALTSLMRLVDTKDRWKVAEHQRPIHAESILRDARR